MPWGDSFPNMDQGNAFHFYKKDKKYITVISHNVLPREYLLATIKNFSNPNEALSLLIYTTKATNNFLKNRKAWLPTQNQLVFNYD